MTMLHYATMQNANKKILASMNLPQAGNNAMVASSTWLTYWSFDGKNMQ